MIVPKNSPGDVIENVELLERLPRTKTRPYLWRARCYCGNEFRAVPSDLRSGRVKSCGCFNRQSLSKRIRHGASRVSGWTPEYRSWAGIKQRCSNPTDRAYRNYGGRGIAICDRWKTSFQNFLDDMGLKPGPGYSIDRIDNDKGYSPENCRWATPDIQNRNRRSVKVVLLGGESMTFKEAAKVVGVSGVSARRRIKRHGITHQEAIDFYALKQSLR